MPGGRRVRVRPKPASEPVSNQKGMLRRLNRAADGSSVVEKGKPHGQAAPSAARAARAYPKTNMGGGTGGGRFADSSSSSSLPTFQKCAGAQKTKTEGEYENSNFLPAGDTRISSQISFPWQ